jgi:hypothetical protein
LFSKAVYCNHVYGDNDSASAACGISEDCDVIGQVTDNDGNTHYELLSSRKLEKCKQNENNFGKVNYELMHFMKQRQPPPPGVSYGKAKCVKP